MYVKFEKALPDADFSIDFTDGTTEVGNEKNYGVWAFQTINGSNVIPMPDFTLISWPESVLRDHGENSHSFSHLMKKFEKVMDTYPFEDRDEKLFWRGADVVCP